MVFVRRVPIPDTLYDFIIYNLCLSLIALPCPPKRNSSGNDLCCHRISFSPLSHCNRTARLQVLFSVLTKFFLVTNAESCWMVAEMEILVRTALTVCLLPNILLCIFGMTGKMTLLGDILALLRCILPSIILPCAFIFPQ